MFSEVMVWIYFKSHFTNHLTLTTTLKKREHYNIYERENIFFCLLSFDISKIPTTKLNY
jgi:hypothetical protein